MKTQIDTAALIAQFQARGGKVQVIAEGTRAIENDRDIYRAMREGKKAQADSIRLAAESEARWHRQHDAFTEGRLNGMSTADAHRQSQEV